MNQNAISFDAVLAKFDALIRATSLVAQSLQAVLPYVQSTATTATAGSAALPAAPAGFLNITLPNGAAAKVPYYNV